jgi:hypothetical protein
MRMREQSWRESLEGKGSWKSGPIQGSTVVGPTPLTATRIANHGPGSQHCKPHSPPPVPTCNLWSSNGDKQLIS